MAVYLLHLAVSWRTDHKLQTCKISELVLCPNP
jgi:hypothetical protein